MVGGDKLEELKRTVLLLYYRFLKDFGDIEGVTVRIRTVLMVLIVAPVLFPYVLFVLSTS